MGNPNKMDLTQASALRERITRFLQGPRCVHRDQPATDELMRQWIDGVLSRDPEATDKLKVAIKFSLAEIAKADAAAPLSGLAKDARHCHAKRAEILEAIQRAMTEGAS